MNVLSDFDIELEKALAEQGTEVSPKAEEPTPKKAVKAAAPKKATAPKKAAAPKKATATKKAPATKKAAAAKK